MINEGTELSDWGDFMTYEFADKNQCGQRVGSWGIMLSELRPHGLEVLRYTLEIRWKDIVEIVPMVKEENFVGSD